MRKLTLRLESTLIKRAKRKASRSGKSVSELVGDYFNLLGDEGHADAAALPPATRALHGALAGASVDEEAFRLHQAEKHRS